MLASTLQHVYQYSIVMSVVADRCSLALSKINSRPVE